MSLKHLARNPNLRWLGYTRFFNIAGRHMIRTVFPAFVASLGLSPIQIGIVDALDEVPGTLSFLANKYIRKFGEKTCLIYAKLLVILSPITFFFSSAWPGVALGSAFSATGRHVEHSIVDSITMNSVKENMKARAKSFISMFSALAIIIAPFSALLIMNQLGIRSVFIFALISFLISLLLITKVKTNPFKFEKITYGKHKFLYLIAFLFYLAIENEKFLFFTAKIDRGVSNTMIAVFVLISGIIALAVKYPVGKAIDRFGYKSALIFFSTVLGILFFIWGYTPISLLIVSFTAIDIMRQALKTSYISYSASEIEQSERSRIFTSMMSIGHMAAGISSLVSGLLWEFIGAHAVFFLSGITCFVLTVVVLNRGEQVHELN